VRFDNGQFGTTSRRQPSALIITTGCVAKPPQKSQLLPARYELGLRRPERQIKIYSETLMADKPVVKKI
jgi:hypothetical protein